MSFIRSCLFISLISLPAALGLLALGSVMGYEEFRGGYAVLTTGDSIDDKTLRSSLEKGAAFFGGSPVSESSQWVMLDEFDAVRAIPLDTYSLRVASFDPRNDGYAEKVRQVFLRDGKRFVYVPLKAGNWNSSLLEKQFNDLLGNIPFSVEYYGIGRPLHLFFIAYAAASIGLFVICLVKKKSHIGAANIIVLIPVFSSLAFFGAAGIAAAALLFALFIMLREPLNELVTLTGSFLKQDGNIFKLIYKEIILSYKYYWFFLPVFALFFSALIIFSQLKVLFFLAVLICALAVFFLSLRILTFSAGSRKRFAPVLIMRHRFPEFAFSFFMLPFVIAAFLTFFFTPYMSGSYVSNSKFDAMLNEQDYLAHLSYQASFSTQQFGASFSAFPAFFLDTDGLPSMYDYNSANQAVNIDNFPPFPLKNLMDFFHNVNSGKRTDAGSGTSTRFTELMSLLVLLLFLFPGLFFRTKGDSPPKLDFSGLKRFSAELRLKGINWNKTHMYNKKNPLRFRKDA